MEAAVKIKELESLYWIKAQIEMLEKELKEIDGLKGNKITDMPKGNETGKPTENVAMLRIKYAERITKEKEKYLKKKLEIEEFIEQIDNEEVKAIARYKFIYRKGWVEITRDLYNNYCDKYTPRRVLERYLEKIDKNN